MHRVALRDVHKRFGSTQALRGADLELDRAEIHALLGENGAGKTTLVRALYGMVRPDRGEILIDGVAREISGPGHALSLGIGLVHQHFMLVPELSVAENLALGEALGFHLAKGALRSRAVEILARYDLDLDPQAPAGSLAVAQQQRLEIARALSRGVEVLVLDEPTAVLAPSEVVALLSLLARLRDEGTSVLLISHKLEEITAVCDRVTVLRAGRTVVSRAVEGVDARELGRWMVGEAPPLPGRPAESRPGAPALRLRGLRAEGLDGLELELREGEVLAVAGIDGNGQGPLEEVLAGVRPLTGGALELLRAPLAVLSGDRTRTGLVLDLSIAENLALPEAARGGPLFRHGILRTSELRRAAREAIARFEIRGSEASEARALSGGNQQKLCVARALRGDPKVLVAVNPTRGLDVASTVAVRDEIRSAARGGTAVLLISTDLDEVLELGNRIAVLFRGRLCAVEPGQETRERIGELMLGGGTA
ncbi:MAG: ATP-binding cassette domain-containing protein [Myxococcota bacterium]